MRLKLLLSTLLLAALINAPSAFAQEVDPSEIPSPSVVPTQAPVSYTLPYPGLLPDHSFYFFKITRDKIMGFLISSPLKKAEFDLLQADKTVQAASVLVSKGKDKYVLAESTLAKGPMYFEEALVKAQDAKKEGLDISDLARRLALANRKHVEVIKEMQQKVGKDEGKKFEKHILKMLDLGKRVKELKP